MRDIIIMKYMRCVHWHAELAAPVSETVSVNHAVDLDGNTVYQLSFDNAGPAIYLPARDQYIYSMNTAVSNRKARIVYFSHGGGPLPMQGDTGHAAMVEFMRNLPALFPRPEAIVVVSAHWEMDAATLLGATRPPTWPWAGPCVLSRWRTY